MTFIRRKYKSHIKKAIGHDIEVEAKQYGLILVELVMHILKIKKD